MSKILSVAVALAGVCALSSFLLSCGSSSSRPSGALYVLTQGSSGQGNNVSSFAMDLDTGNLALINSNASTCPTMATNNNTNPCGLPVQIVLNPAGSAAFVLDQGAPPCPTCSPVSNSNIAPAVYPYTENSDGSLSSPGTGITWTCADAVSSVPNPCNFSDTAVAMVRDSAGQFLFVIDHGTYPSPGFPIVNSPYPSCPHAPTDVNDVCPSLSVLSMTSGSPSLVGTPLRLSKLPTALSVISFTPPGSTTAQELLFVTNNVDICTQNCKAPSPNNDSTVSVYNVDSSGALTEQVNSPYSIVAANPIAIQAVNTNLPGQTVGGPFVYVGSQDQNGGAIYPFQVCWVLNANCSTQDVAGNLMVPIATCLQPSCNVPPSVAGSKPVGMLVDPTNNFLYVVSELSSQVFGFKIGTTVGTLTVLNPPNLPTGSQPVSMVLHPTVNNTGQFLYTSNSNSSNITGFVLDTTSGAMSSPITVVAPAAPSGMAVH